MDCTEIKVLLSGLLDDRIEDATRHEAERHLVDCEACRGLIDEAERNETLIAAAAAGPTGLPAGFEAGVLHRTVHADRSPGHGRLTAWLGWIAAAASLAFAATLWVLDNRPTPTTPAPVLAKGLGAPNLLKGDLVPETWRSPPALGAPPDAVSVVPGMQATLASAVHVSEPFDLARSQADALTSAVRLLGIIQRSDLTSFADVEQVRRLAEDDALLRRLADTRRLLPLSEQAPLFAAETVLHRIVRGPLSISDLRELQAMIDDLDLARQISGITGRRPSTPSI